MNYQILMNYHGACPRDRSTLILLRIKPNTLRKLFPNFIQVVSKSYKVIVNFQSQQSST